MYVWTFLIENSWDADLVACDTHVSWDRLDVVLKLFRAGGSGAIVIKPQPTIDSLRHYRLPKTPSKYTTLSQHIIQLESWPTTQLSIALEVDNVALSLKDWWCFCLKALNVPHTSLSNFIAQSVCGPCFILVTISEKKYPQYLAV